MNILSGDLGAERSSKNQGWIRIWRSKSWIRIWIQFIQIFKPALSFSVRYIFPDFFQCSGSVTFGTDPDPQFGVEMSKKLD
jgi:hypothetical protein